MAHVRRGGLLALIISCAAAWPSLLRAQQAAPEAAAQDPAAQVDQLIRQLGDDNWQVRQKAQDRLVRMGTDIRGQLAAALKQATDEEVRSRLEAIIRLGDEVRATGTSYITIHLKQASPRDVFAELARQASAPMRTIPANLWDSRAFDAKDIDIDREPFWKAMKQVCDAYGVAPQANGMDREMLIGDRAAGVRILGDAPMFVNGPFVVVAATINRRNFVDLNQPKNVQRNCTVQLMVLAEPKVRVLQGSWMARIDEALDEKGNSLQMPQAGNEGMMNPGNSWMWNMSANLMPRSGASEKIARLKGSGHFMMQTRSETAEIPDVLSAKNVTKFVAGKRFVLKEVRKTGENTYEAQVTLFRAASNPNEWNFMFTNTFRLLDARGNALMKETPNIANAGANSEVFEMKVPFRRNSWNNGEAAGEPVKLVWEIPVETRDVTVPFEFKDLPLP